MTAHQNRIHETSDGLLEAELFDAIAHPTRIMILQLLHDHPFGFSELKKQLGISSSGNVQHHLNKMTRLITTDNLGKYQLSDQGREAIHAIKSVQQVPNSKLSTLTIATLVSSLAFYVVQMNIPFLFNTVSALTPIKAFIETVVYSVVFYTIWRAANSIKKQSQTIPIPESP